jgi:mRNA-degrading endonuclease toxin of MazEF toxin-antitoxin module
MVVPILTSALQGKRGPIVVEIPGGSGGLPRGSFALCHQVSTLDRTKFAKRIRVLTTELLRAVEVEVKAAIDL